MRKWVKQKGEETIRTIWNHTLKNQLHAITQLWVTSLLPACRGMSKSCVLLSDLLPYLYALMVADCITLLKFSSILCL